MRVDSLAHEVSANEFMGSRRAAFDLESLYRGR